jgi:hypothetical protein
VHEPSLFGDFFTTSQDKSEVAGDSTGGGLEAAERLIKRVFPAEMRFGPAILVIAKQNLWRYI